MDATADLDAAAQLDAWLKKHVAEPRRTLARGAASNLSDYATCEEADLEDVLQISTWPPLARSRFLRAWRKLKGDEAPPAGCDGSVEELRLLYAEIGEMIFAP